MARSVVKAVISTLLEMQGALLAPRKKTYSDGGTVDSAKRFEEWQQGVVSGASWELRLNLETPQ